MPSRKKEKWVVVVSTKGTTEPIGIVGTFSSKKKAEEWIACTPDLDSQNDREIHQLLEPN